ncbi:MAG TPA: hypothetical protein VGO04_09365 [Ensifer sp.]|jgi:hypothetical protein|uniref:hypothetical protein n=1 Tax=Ensifer sp. TaxID=1872086 RepID=UPI002E12B823|nr:hypothetical protein [Ensifer sp.]
MTAYCDVWLGKASAVARQFLARRQALQIVTIQADHFLAWLEAHQLLNTSANRLRYVEMRATAATATAAEIAAEAHVCQHRETALFDQWSSLDQDQKHGETGEM